MQQFDTRKTVDCKFFLFGTCTKGPACPFRHDPTMITVARTQQSQQDCIYFLQGRCSKGSLCPFKHDQAKLPLALQGLGGGQSVTTAAVSAAAAGPGRAAQQPITVDFGASGSPEGIPGPTVGMAHSNRGPSPAQQPVAAPAPRRAVAPVQRSQQQKQQPAIRSASQQQQQQPAIRSASQQQQQQPQRSQPEQGAAGRSSVFSRLAGRLGPTVASGSDGERQSPKKARPTREAVAKDSNLAEAQLAVERAVRPPARRGGGALGVALSALQSVVRREASGEFAEDSKLQRTIVLEQPSRKRRLGSEEQSVKFVEDDVPAIAASSPPRGKKPAVTARLRPAPAAVVSPAAAPAPSSAPAQAPARLPQPVAEGSGKQEQAAEFRPPKSLRELRKERQQQQRSSGSQERPAQAANSQQAVHSKPKKHKPIQWQPESAQPVAASQAAADERGNEATPPAAAPSAVVSGTEAAAAPVKPPSKEQQPTAAPATAAPAAAEPAGKSEVEQGAEDAGMDMEDEEFDMGEGDGGDEDIDDFEAQMRALEEQL